MVVGSFGALIIGGERQKNRRELDQRGLKLEKWCTCKRKAASLGTERVAGGRDGREGGRGGRWRKS